MAVAPRRRGQGVGRALVDAAVAAARAGGASRLEVATAAADVGNLRFYQRCGFRLRDVERDAFTPGTGYSEDIDIDGIPLRDRVRLDRDLP
jgi:GNAT superfamily N-acetyltransferase